MSVAIERLRLAVLAAVPFLFVPALAEQRELPRHTLVAVMAFGALIATGRPLVQDRLQWAFLAILGAATLAATSPLRSFYGPYEGHFGLLAWLAYLALLVNPPPPFMLPAYAAVMVGIGAVETGAGVYQRFALGAAPRGTLGHLAFFGAFASLASLAAAGLVLETGTKARRWLAALGGLVAFAALPLSGRRGALLAFLVGLALMARRADRTGRARLAAYALGCALVYGSLAWVRIPGIEIPAMTRVTGMASPENDTLLPRFDFYRVAAARVVERPLLGYGFGSFRDQFAAERRDVSGFELRVHDLWLELALAGGLGALAAFLAMLARWARAGLVERDGARSACASIGVAYLVYLTFNFDQPGVGAWAATMTAFAIATPARARVRGWGVAGCALLMAAALVRFSADFMIGRALALETAGERDGAGRWFSRAVALAPYECTYALRRVAFLRASDAPGSAEERIASLARCAALEPANAFVHYHLGLAHLEHPDAGPVRRAEAIAALHRATELAPGFAGFHQGLAKALALSGALPAALGEIDRALALDPRDAGFHNDRGNVLVLMQRADLALESYRRARDLQPEEATYRNNHDRLAAELRAR